MQSHWMERVQGDLCDFLPAFLSTAQPYERSDYDFGISDIRNVPGWDSLLRVAALEAASKVPSLATRLPGMQGHGELCEFLASLITHETGFTTAAKDMILTDGGCDGIALAARAVCGSGEGIAYAVPSFPYWWVLSHAGIPQLPVVFSDARDYSRNFGSKMVQALRDEPRLRAVIVNEPHNPLGVALSHPALCELAEYVTKHDVMVILDDVGRGVVEYPKDKWWGSVFPAEKIIVVDSFTKRYGVPGLRLGFVGPCTRYLPHVRGMIANCRAGVSNVAAQTGLCIAEQLRRVGIESAIRSEIASRLAAMRQSLPSALPDTVRYVLPEWGMYCVVDCSRYLPNAMSGRELAAHLRAVGLRVMDDRFLFPPGVAVELRRGLIRLSVGAESRVAEGVTRLGALLRQFASQFGDSSLRG